MQQHTPLNNTEVIAHSARSRTLYKSVPRRGWLAWSTACWRACGTCWAKMPGSGSAARTMASCFSAAALKPSTGSSPILASSGATESDCSWLLAANAHRRLAKSEAWFSQKNLMSPILQLSAGSCCNYQRPSCAGQSPCTHVDELHACNVMPRLPAACAAASATLASTGLPSFASANSMVIKSGSLNLSNCLHRVERMSG